jgi:multiple sugar transport system substrate-binding protein
LDDLLDGSSILKRSAFPEQVLEAMSWKGRLYGLPFAFTPQVLLYNKSVFRKLNIKEPDENWYWRKLYSVAKDIITKLKNAEKKLYPLGWFPHGHNFYLPFITQSSGNIFERNQNTKEALTLLAEMATNREICPPFLDMKVRLAPRLLENGSIAMLIGNYSDYCDLRETLADDLGITFLPKQKTRSSALAVQGWGISAKSKKPNDSFMFMEEFTNKKTMELLHHSLGRIPAYNPLQHNPPDIFMRSLDFSEPTWPHPSRELLDAIDEKVVLLVNGLSSPEETYEEISKEIKESEQC